MLYCLFRHAASQVLRDVAVRTGQRVVVRQLSGGALSSMLGSVGVSVTQRMAGTAASRWVPRRRRRSPSAAMRTGTRCRSRRPRAGCSDPSRSGARFTAAADPRMCGRYELHTHPAAIALAFGLLEPPDARPRYNIAPTQQVPVVRQRADGTRELASRCAGASCLAGPRIRRSARR